MAGQQHETTSSYSNITADGHTRMHIGAHHGDTVTNNATTYNTNHHAPISSTSRRKWYEFGSSKKEQQKLNADFLRAVRERQLQRMEVLFARGVEIDLVDEKYGLSALHWACGAGHLDVVNSLVNKGFDINPCSRFYGTPICVAALQGHTEIVSRMIALHADLTRSGVFIGTALHAACRRKRSGVVQRLLSAGISPNATATWCVYSGGATDVPFEPFDTQRLSGCWCFQNGPPSGCAVYVTGYTELALLFDKGAVVNAFSLEWGVGGKRIFDEGSYDPKNADPSCIIPLEMAIRGGDLELLQLLLRHGADPDLFERTVTLEPAFITAVDSRQPGLLRLLLDGGASVNVRGCYGRTAMHVAVERQHLESVQLLGERGAKVSLGDDAGETPLHQAVKLRDTNIVSHLLSLGADVGAVDVRGNTPLHTATVSRLLNNVRILLEHGANVNARNRSDETALSLVEWKDFLLAGVLKSYGGRK